MNIFNYIKDKVSYKEIFEAYSIPYEEYGDEKFAYKAKCPLEGCARKKGKKSFTVIADGKMFYCFNCHKCGDITSLVASLNNITPIDSVKKLIQYYHDWKTKEPLKIVKECEKSARETLGDYFVNSYLVK